MASHCRNCKLSFVLVEPSEECKNLCKDCEPLYHHISYAPEYYYCKSCKEFCLRDEWQGRYSVYSYPYCYGCDPSFCDEDEEI